MERFWREPGDGSTRTIGEELFSVLAMKLKAVPMRVKVIKAEKERVCDIIEKSL